MFDGTYCSENAKTCKVDAIVREIGQQPVLAFGNSSGDLAMQIYTISDKPYRSVAYRCWLATRRGNTAVQAREL